MVHFLRALELIKFVWLESNEHVEKRLWGAQALFLKFGKLRSLFFSIY